MSSLIFEDKLFLGSPNGLIEVCDVEHDQPQLLIKSSDPISCLASDKNKCFATSSNRRSHYGGSDPVHIWEKETGNKVASVFTGWAAGPITSLAFNPQEPHFLATTGWGSDSTERRFPGEIRVWDLRSLDSNNIKCLHKIDCDFAKEARYNQDGSYLVGSNSGAYSLWIWAPGTTCAKRLSDECMIDGIAFHPWQNELANGSGSYISIWDLHNTSYETI